MVVRQRAGSLRCLLRRQIALGFRQHLVSHHELFDGGGSQQRGFVLVEVLGLPPARDPREVYNLMPPDGSQEHDMREILRCFVDGGELTEYKAEYGKTVLCAYARVCGWALSLDQALASAVHVNALVGNTEDFKEGITSFLEKEGRRFGRKVKGGPKKCQTSPLNFRS